MLLCDFPFNGKDVNEISKSVRFNLPDFTHEEFKHVSKECIDLITKLLEKDKDNRISSSEALAHPWFNDINEMFHNTDVNKHEISLEKTLKSFSV